jgi:hypothetical protein
MSQSHARRELPTRWASLTSRSSARRRPSFSQHYRLFNGRPLLRLSEVIAAINASREDGNL